MATPVLTATADQTGPYLPGAPCVVSWTVVDADNSSETIEWTGHDSQGNTVSGTVVIARQDTFTMDSVKWQRTGQAFVVDNANRKANSVVPSA
jgi:hypothetical protein